MKCTPAPVTNQRAFEMHRLYLEAELGNAQPIPPCAPYVDADLHQVIWYGRVWMGRYMRCRHAIEGTYDGPLADIRAKQALIARYRARDATVTALPDWTPFMLKMMDMSLLNTSRGGAIELSSMDQPHSYGPSLRSLWAEGKRLGKSPADAWEHLLAWGRHRPACWDRQEQQAAVGETGRTIVWKATNNLDHPWAAAVDGEHWQVRLNDFPDDFMYTLVIEGTAAGDFHDWPATWQRG
jgi:hypothetical protein